MKCSTRYVNVLRKSAGIVWLGSVIMVMSNAVNAADLTFFTCSDMHYNEPAETNAVQAGLIDMMNALPGKSFPSSVGGGTVDIPRGVIIPGDLIDDGQAPLALITREWALWEADFGLTGEGRLNFPVYEGYGNHDYNGILYLENKIKARNLLRADVVAISDNGFHYAWEWEGIHFVELNLYPGTERSPGQSPRYSLPFLREDLEQNVGNRRRPVFIAQHYMPTDDWWTDAEKTYYYSVIRDYNIIGITHGHQGQASIYKWNGIDVVDNHHFLSTGCFVFNIATNNKMVIAQRTPADSWGLTYTKTLEFPNLNQAWHPLPADGSQVAETTLTRLAWTPGDAIVSQDVYFGTSFTAVDQSTTPALAGLGAAVTNRSIPASYLPLQLGTHYYWRIDTHSTSGGTVKGTVWQFRTKDAVNADEMTFLFISDSHVGVGSLASARDTVVAMNTIPETAWPADIGGGIVKTPRGVIHGGDYTQDGATWEYDVFVHDYGINGDRVLQYPVYETWGNHDENGPKDYIAGLKARHAFRPDPLNLSADQLYYSWDWGNVHFVSLGRNPNTASLTFLKTDLAAKVGNTGRPVVLYHHYGVDEYGITWWSADLQTEYYDIIQDYNIIGIFHGHTHDSSIYTWNGIDIFNAPHLKTSPAVEHGFLAVNIASNSMRVAERTAAGSWGLRKRKTIFTSFAEGGVAAFINNGAGATNITGTSALLNGTLVYEASGPTAVAIYYGPTDGGTTATAWTGSVEVGTVGIGQFSVAVSNLMAETGYYYRCYAVNASGEDWADESRQFSTLSAAEIDNGSGAGNVRMTTATLNGTLTAKSFTPTHVYIYWGTTDGEETIAAWDHVVVLGSREIGSFSAGLMGLTMETTYYYRSYATNAVGEKWAADSSSFTTQPPLSIDNEPGATEMTAASGSLNGTLLITNAAPTHVFIYWGKSDGGTNRSGWDTEIALGIKDPGAFSAQITGLASDTKYYYRCYGSNAAGGRWASSSVAFSTAKDFSQWQAKMKITIGGYTRATALVNFPLFVVLNENIPGFSYTHFASRKGADLRFGSSTDTELKYEIEQWNVSGDSFVWVQVPRISGPDTFITAYWGNPAHTAFPGYTTNGSVWAEGYAGVWHMNQKNLINSVNGQAGKAYNEPQVIANGNTGISMHFRTGVVTYVDVGDVDVQSLTMSAWQRDDVSYAGQPDRFVMEKKNSYSWYQWNVDWHIQMGIEGTTRYDFQQGGVTDNPYPAWTYLAVTYDATTGVGCGYKDAAQRYSQDKGDGIVPNQNNNALRIGARSTGLAGVYGELDEVRVSRVVRSPDWIWACWRNQGPDRGAFAQYQVLQPGTVFPGVNIITADTVVDISLPLVIQGTNDEPVVGTMWVSNAATGQRLEFHAASAWRSPGIDCEMGNNSIHVFGTNSMGLAGSDMITVVGVPEGAGLVVIGLTMVLGARIRKRA